MLSLVLAFSANVTAGFGQSTASRPNILFILVDDLGYKDLGYMGSTYYETPYIDQLAAQGIIFTDAYAASPVCSPSRASILTGKYPARLNLTDYIPGNRHWGPHTDQMLASPPFELAVSQSETTIAEALKQKGYTTFFAGKWHLGDGEGNLPRQHGFDINVAGNGTGHPAGGYFAPYANPQLSDGPEGEYLTDRLTSETIRFISANREKPFFAFLSFYTVHLPMQAKQKKIDKYADKLSETDRQPASATDAQTFHKTQQNTPRYAAMVESMDENVGRLLGALQENGLSKNTVVIFTSDNGGMSTNSQPEGIPTSNAPLRAGKGYLYEGGIKVPLIIRWPEKITPGSICQTPVAGVDFHPSLLRIAGIPYSPQAIDGKDITPLFDGLPLGNRPLFWHYPHYSGGLGGTPSGAVRLGPYKLIEFYEDQHTELYDLANDQSEQSDLSELAPKKLQELKDLLDNWRSQVNAQMPYPNPAFKE